ncbi:hydantoinase/oxoprolinase family protein [Derxia lacustris]|uniref:hydantoinase/oxoprolinase family protein n=1 Tax=Derxia lacustris TaxID=764842 RepID=UPI00111C7E18|nr:hydantoinase/oxoprolinase family protein [Derxia lacustris]
MLDDGESVVGWDVGGAHVKAALARDGRIVDIVQWPCPLWQGLDHLDHAIEATLARWPAARHALHAVTMTGEMTDLFANREAGVVGIASHMQTALGPGLLLYAGPERWIAPAQAQAHWHAVASANWLASAELVARNLRDALLVDIGSTTTDLIAVRDGKVLSLGRPPAALAGAHDAGRDDVSRLASGELVYLGVVRTPLCALARRIAFGGRDLNVMNEFFATSADVFRLTGELDPEHDQHAPADNGAKTAEATRARLARMVGLDARDASEDAWLGFAREWRRAFVDELRFNLGRVLAAAGLPASAPLVAAGCGSFLVEGLAQAGGRHVLGFERMARLDRPLSAVDEQRSRWARVCAPSVAVALLGSSVGAEARARR